MYGPVSSPCCMYIPFFIVPVIAGVGVSESDCVVLGFSAQATNVIKHTPINKSASNFLMFCSIHTVFVIRIAFNLSSLKRMMLDITAVMIPDKSIMMISIGARIIPGIPSKKNPIPKR